MPSLPAVAIAIAGSVALIALAWPWRVALTMQVRGGSGPLALHGDLEVGAFSARAAGLAGGPVLVRVRLWTRSLWQRRLGTVTLDTILASFDDRRSRSVGPQGQARGRHLELGLRLYRALLVRSLRLRVVLGSRDPVLTGELAACLHGATGILSPFARIEVDLDWSGTSRVDLDVEFTFRVLLARVVFEVCRFLWQRTKLYPTGESTS